MDNEVAKARAAMAAKFGKAQLGGKGTWPPHIISFINLHVMLL